MVISKFLTFCKTDQRVFYYSEYLFVILECDPKLAVNRILLKATHSARHHKAQYCSDPGIHCSSRRPLTTI